MQVDARTARRHRCGERLRHSSTTRAPHGTACPRIRSVEARSLAPRQTGQLPPDRLSSKTPRSSPAPLRRQRFVGVDND